MLRYPSGSSSVSYVRLRKWSGVGLSLIDDWQHRKQRQQKRRRRQQQHAASNVWYEPVAMSRVAGVYRLASKGLAEQDLLCQNSRCSLLHACPSRRVLPWLCPARLADYFWFFVRPLRNPDMGHSQGGLAKAKDTPCCLCCQGQSFGRKEFSNWEGGI